MFRDGGTTGRDTEVRDELLGDGTRLFDRVGPEHIELETTRVIDSAAATHFTFQVVAKR